MKTENEILEELKAACLEYQMYENAFKGGDPEMTFPNSSQSFAADNALRKINTLRWVLGLDGIWYTPDLLVWIKSFI